MINSKSRKIIKILFTIVLIVVLFWIAWRGYSYSLRKNQNGIRIDGYKELFTGKVISITDSSLELQDSQSKTTQKYVFDSNTKFYKIPKNGAPVPAQVSDLKDNLYIAISFDDNQTIEKPVKEINILP